MSSRRGTVAEAIAWGETLLGLGLKISLASGANVLLLLGLSSLALIYFMRAFLRPAADDTSAPKADFLTGSVLPTVAGIASAVVFIGTSFKLLNLPGSFNLLAVGTGTLLLATGLLALRRQVSRPVVIVGALGLLMLLLPDELLIRQFHRDDPVLVEKMIYQLYHPHDPAASAAVRQYLQQKSANR